jgi:hypothetical protein
MPPKSKTATKATGEDGDPKWLNHPARDVLLKAFLDGDIPIDWDGTRPEDIYRQFAHTDAFNFGGMSFEPLEFKRRLKSLQGIARRQKNRVVQDKIAFDIFRQNFPVRQNNNVGDLRWNGSLAEQFLKLDMKANVHEGKKPAEFRATRPEYQEFSKERFRKHVDQEKRLWKMENFLADMTAKKEEAKKKKQGSFWQRYEDDEEEEDEDSDE